MAELYVKRGRKWPFDCTSMKFKSLIARILSSVNLISEFSGYVGKSFIKFVNGYRESIKYNFLFFLFHLFSFYWNCFFQSALLLSFIPSNSLIQARSGAIFCLLLHTLLWPVQSSRGGSR